MFVSDSALRTHVRESNSIEGITAMPGSPLYDGHLVAARTAAVGVCDANHLHRLIMRSVSGMQSSAGAYRSQSIVIESRRTIMRAGKSVGVGPVSRRPLPHATEVPSLMERWGILLDEFASTQEDLEEKAFLLHAWLLSIHPWRDGNGRTARLVWNMLRLSKGLPWHIEPARTKQHYYARIRSVERVFMSHYGEEIY